MKLTSQMSSAISVTPTYCPGYGADAAPYLRIFNPATQAQKFDPRGDYVARWVPEIDAPGYPRPIVNHTRARERALEALAAIKQL